MGQTATDATNRICRDDFAAIGDPVVVTENGSPA